MITTDYTATTYAKIAVVFLILTSLITGCASINKVQYSQSKDARACIGAIYNAVKFYRQDFGCDPASVEELIKKEYLALDESSARQWKFNLIGSNPIFMIEAVSTHEMTGGAGHIVLFDIQSAKFHGYGCDNR